VNRRVVTLLPSLLLALTGALLPAAPAAADNRCSITVRLYNHNRFAYDTDEECGPFHSPPYGNWGVSSNVGSKVDGDQFQGWHGSCSSFGDAEWNSCAVGYARPNCGVFNFPYPGLGFPAPPGYPFADVYAHNNCATGAFPCICVDQVSPCGPNDYGGRTLYYGVGAPYDSDCDGVIDSGGCAGLDGLTVTIGSNFMTVYELDMWETDDVVQSLYYPDVSVQLDCTRQQCWAANDLNRDGYVDDLWDRGSPAWRWPTRYIDEWNQDRKRIDATIRIGRVGGSYSGEFEECNPACGYCPPEPPPPCPPEWLCPIE
jgi:hypothetical protein